MNSGLLRKEVRELRPFIVLIGFLLLLDVYDWLSMQFDVRPLAWSFPDFGVEMAAVLFLIAFAMGTGLLIREMDDRTLAFLDGLPVSRSKIFSVKVLAASTVLLAYPLGYVLLLAAQHLVARQSLDHALHPGLLWQALAMMSVLTGTGLGLGLLLGFLRNLSWLVLALAAIAISILTRLSPALDFLIPMKLLDADLVGIHWPLPVAAVATQLGLMLVCMLLALVLFRATGDAQGRLQARLNRPLVSASVTLATIGGGIALLAMYGASEMEEDDVDVGDDGPYVAGATFTSSPAGNAVTAHYSFSYPARQAGNLQSLLREADTIHAQVAGLLGAQPGARIDVDLSGSAENTAGTAFHDRIRMRQGDDAPRILAHETAHVLARRLAGGERERELSKMGALNEGLAHWIENKVISGSGLAEDDKLQAALVSRRQLFRVEELADLIALQQQVDLSLQYPLGAMVVDCLVARYGEAAPGKLMVALGDPDFPRDLQGTELWFAAFQAAGYDLSLVYADYARRLKSLEAEFADRISQLPRPRGSLVRDEESVGVELRFDGQMQEGWQGVVRFRPDEDSDLTEYSMTETDEEQIAWVSASRLSGERVCFQPGVGYRGALVFETWTCLPLDSAADY